MLVEAFKDLPTKTTGWKVKTSQLDYSSCLSLNWCDQKRRWALFLFPPSCPRLPSGLGPYGVGIGNTGMFGVGKGVGIGWGEASGREDGAGHIAP